MEALFRHVKILPVLIVILALSFGLRVGEFLSGQPQTSGLAFAEEAAAPPAEEPRTVETSYDSENEGQQSTEADDSALGQAPPARPSAEDGESWRDSLDEDFEFSEVRMELFEDLSNRRKALEQREKEMNMREALLKAAEQELDQKYRELLSLREEIQALLETQSKQEEERIASLVKIYEGMKAKDAARIFNTLDTDVLLMVMGKMSERKSAPIIAAMNPDRARMITIMLAEQKALPDANELLQ